MAKYIEQRIAELEADVARLATLVNNIVHREKRYVTLQIDKIKREIKRDRIKATQRRPVRRKTVK